VQPGKITQGSLDRVLAELRPQVLRRHPPSETNDKSFQSTNKKTSLDRVLAELRPQVLRRHPPSETNDKSFQSTNKQTNKLTNRFFKQMGNGVGLGC